MKQSRECEKVDGVLYWQVWLSHEEFLKLDKLLNTKGEPCPS